MNRRERWGAALDTVAARPTERALASVSQGLAVWLPRFCVTSASGLLLVATADTAARYQQTWAPMLFWLGLLTIFAPVALRLTSRDPDRLERLSLVILVSLALYCVKILHSPLLLTQHDEFLHWRTLNDIIRTGHLFEANPLLPASALYPGLEIVASAIYHLSGLSVFPVAVILMGLVRVVLILSLFFVFERITMSSYVAGLAALFYIGNWNFLFFNSMFKYESIALALAAVAIYAMLRWHYDASQYRTAFGIVTLIALTALVISHHMTAFLMIVFLALWLVASLVRRHGPEEHSFIARMLIFVLVVHVIWLMLVARQTISYLEPVLGGAVTSVVRMVSDTIQPASAPTDAPATRQLFQGSEAQSTPVWERAVTLLSVFIIMLGIPFGLFEAWRRLRSRAIVWALAVVSCMFPVALMFRLTGRGWETANRSSVFVFIALATLISFAVVRLLLARFPNIVTRMGVTAALCVLFLGGVIAGWPPDWRLPGPYVADEATRSIEPVGITSAEWARSHLGAGNRMAADSANHLLMGSIGEQHVQTSLSGGLDPKWVLFAPAINSEIVFYLRRNETDYIVVDWRLATRPMMASKYFPGTTTGEALEKFDRTPGIYRVYDSGYIAIYDVRDVWRAR